MHECVFPSIVRTSGKKGMNAWAFVTLSLCPIMSERIWKESFLLETAQLYLSLIKQYAVSVESYQKVTLPTGSYVSVCEVHIRWHMEDPPPLGLPFNRIFYPLPFLPASYFKLPTLTLTCQSPTHLSTHLPPTCLSFCPCIWMVACPQGHPLSLGRERNSRSQLGSSFAVLARSDEAQNPINIEPSHSSGQSISKTHKFFSC